VCFAIPLSTAERVAASLIREAARRARIGTGGRLRPCRGRWRVTIGSRRRPESATSVEAACRGRGRAARDVIGAGGGGGRRLLTTCSACSYATAIQRVSCCCASQTGAS
jgi:hypothetical protein